MLNEPPPTTANGCGFALSFSFFLGCEFKGASNAPVGLAERQIKPLIPDTLSAWFSAVPCFPSQTAHNGTNTQVSAAAIGNPST